MTQLETIIQQINDHRDKAIIDLVANTGIYLDELKELSLNEIKHQEIEIKGKRPRTIALSNDTYNNIKKWILKRPHTDHNYVFTTITGKCQPLSSRGVDHILRKWSSKLNVDMNYQKLRSGHYQKESNKGNDFKTIGLGLILVAALLKLAQLLR